MSIGPSLTARDRSGQTTRTGDRTETAASQADSAEEETASFALQYAKWTFDPFNTRPCPEMFTDKWSVGE